MTGVAPADETASHPTEIPADGPRVAGEAAGPIGDGTVQIAYLHPGLVSHSWHMSMMNLIAYDKTIGLDVIQSMPYAVSCSGPNSLIEGRNQAVQHFLEETDHDWLFFVDTDMGFEADAMERLLLAAHPVDRPVVGGLCFALKHLGPDGKGGFRVMPIPTLFEWAEHPEQGVGFANRFIYPPDSLVKVAGTGAAFLLIHRSVLEDIDQGWFDLIYQDDGVAISEDLSFCRRVGECGYPVYVDTRIKVTHHKQFWLGELDYKMPSREPMQEMMDRARRSDGGAP